MIPLKKKGIVHSKAAPTAMKLVKKFLQKHMKAAESDIWIDSSLNNAIWSHGKYKVPTKIRVKAVRFEDGVVEAYLPDLEFTKSRREILQEERAKKQPILRKEERTEEEEAETGAEDYDVAPGPDGEVKIKKKKPAKQEDLEEEESKDVPKESKEEISPEPESKKEKKKETSEKVEESSKKSVKKSSTKPVTKKKEKPSKKTSKSASKKQSSKKTDDEKKKSK